MKQQLCEKEESYGKGLSDSDMKAREKLAELSESSESSEVGERQKRVGGEDAAESTMLEL